MPQKIEAALFADRAAEYLMISVEQAWTPEALIARYNLELARGVLYWSDQMQVDIHDSYKDFWRYLKLFKLMFWATPNQRAAITSISMGRSRRSSRRPPVMAGSSRLFCPLCCSANNGRWRRRCDRPVRSDGQL